MLNYKSPVWTVSIFYVLYREKIDIFVPLYFYRRYAFEYEATFWYDSAACHRIKTDMILYPYRYIQIQDDHVQYIYTRCFNHSVIARTKSKMVKNQITNWVCHSVLELIDIMDHAHKYSADECLKAIVFFQVIILLNNVSICL